MCKFTILVKRGSNTYKHTGKIKATSEQEGVSNLSLVYKSFFTKILDVSLL